ncbi:MAG: DUF1697 domain-containing protein [Bacillota bacterium]
MAIYIALLRGINVGGKNMIKMAELKKMCEALGLNRVQTYIQSGNVLFESTEEESTLRKIIENEIEAVFGFSVNVIIRTSEELKKIVADNPFSEEEVAAAEASSVGECLYVSLLQEEPSSEGIERLRVYQSDNEEFRINGREVFLLFGHSVRNSKLANNLHKLNVPATVRNWKTINKLVTLASAMEESR